jgi:hypothetical protein
MNTEKDILKKKLKEKIKNYKISRQNKQIKKKHIDKTFEKLNIDKDLFIEDLKNCQKNNKSNKHIIDMFK